MGNESNHHSILIAGGGTGGVSVAARLIQIDPSLDVAILEPSDKHYYQPLWTLVGAGIFPKEESEREESECIPPEVKWIRDTVTEFLPDENAVLTKSGNRFTYDYLIIALGIQMDWNKIEGLEGNVGKNGICSNYLYETVESTWDNLKNFPGGTALFTQPSTPIKCAGAPQKALYLADEALRRSGTRSKTKLLFRSGLGAIFGIPKYRRALEEILKKKEIDTAFQEDLIAVKAKEKKAIFKNSATGKTTEIEYDLLHVVPPMSAPDVIKKSKLADSAGWVDVDKFQLFHNKYKNVFSLGDCSSLPTSRTGAAIRKQAPVLVENLIATMQKKPMKASYDGYASCPLVTGYGKVILAEFGYDGKIMESFPFDQSKERFSMYMLKAYMLPKIYWHGMLKGNL